MSTSEVESVGGKEVVWRSQFVFDKHEVHAIYKRRVSYVSAAAGRRGLMQASFLVQ